MKKKTLLFTAVSVYEIIRLFFVLIFQAEFELKNRPLVWYVSIPLLIIPLLLLRALYKENKETPLAFELYAAAKAAGIAGFIFFIKHRVTQLQSDVFADKSNLLKTLIYVMPFFTIDVILFLTIMIKNYRQNKKPEGELCK